MHGGLQGFQTISIIAELLQMGLLSLNDLSGFGSILLGARLGSAKITLEAWALATEVLRKPRVSTKINKTHRARRGTNMILYARRVRVLLSSVGPPSLGVN